MVLMDLCEVCKIERASEHVKIMDREWDLCGFDALKANTFINGMKANFVVNINWGSGRIDWGSWYNILDFMNEYKINEVLELGCGLSSELFVASGRTLIGFDEHPTHMEVMKNLVPLHGRATFHH